MCNVSLEDGVSFGHFLTAESSEIFFGFRVIVLTPQCPAHVILRQY